MVIYELGIKTIRNHSNNRTVCKTYFPTVKSSFRSGGSWYILTPPSSKVRPGGHKAVKLDVSPRFTTSLNTHSISETKL